MARYNDQTGQWEDEDGNATGYYGYGGQTYPIGTPAVTPDPNNGGYQQDPSAGIPTSQFTENAPPPSPTPDPDPAPSPAPSYAYMEGVDTGKMADQSHTSPKYVAARILASGGSLADAAKAIGATVIDATRMRLSTGEVIDTRRDSEGANALQWLVEDGNETPAPTTTTTTPTQTTGASGQPTQTIPGVGTFDLAGLVNAISSATQQQAAPAQQNNAQYDALIQLLQSQQQRQSEQDASDAEMKAATRARLMEMMGQNTGDVSLEDQNLAPQVAAYAKTAQRGNESNRAELAEYLTAQGLGDSGTMEAGIERGNQNTADAQAAYNAQLVGQEVSARRSEVLSALQLAIQIGATDEENQLRRELAQLDAQLRTSALESQTALGQGQLNLSLLGTLTGQQNYYDTLGYNYAALQAELNRQALTAALNG